MLLKELLELNEICFGVSKPKIIHCGAYDNALIEPNMYNNTILYFGRNGYLSLSFESYDDDLQQWDVIELTIRVSEYIYVKDILLDYGTIWRNFKVGSFHPLVGFDSLTFANEHTTGYVDYNNIRGEYSYMYLDSVQNDDNFVYERYFIIQYDPQIQMI